MDVGTLLNHVKSICILLAFSSPILITIVARFTTTVDSTTELEYILLFMVAKEAVWSRKFIYELGVVPCIVDPILEYWDVTPQNIP